MAISYKICVVKKFEEEKIGKKQYIFGGQKILEGVSPPPQTVIYKSSVKIPITNFSCYSIEHEYEDTTYGRIDGHAFTKYIRKGFISGYYQKIINLLLLSGKKRDILDFCKKIHKEILDFSTVEIDLKKLLILLPSISGVWFNMPDGPIRASALMGSHIEDTNDFKKFCTTGDISTLSFYYEKDKNLHPIMVTQDGTVVLQGNYAQKKDEIELVLDIKQRLLDTVIKIEEEKNSNKKPQISEDHKTKPQDHL
jgi:hypothetical protein